MTKFQLNSARNAVKTSSSYKEFKMKLDLLGLSIYDIDVLTATRNSLMKTTKLKYDFFDDIMKHIDVEESLLEYTLKRVGYFIRNQCVRMSPLDSLLVNIWTKLHKNDFKLI